MATCACSEGPPVPSRTSTSRIIVSQVGTSSLLHRRTVFAEKHRCRLVQVLLSITPPRKGHGAPSHGETVFRQRRLVEPGGRHPMSTTESYLRESRTAESLNQMIAPLNKGIGSLEQALTPGEIRALGWNLLREDLSLPTAVLHEDRLLENPPLVAPCATAAC